jgi:hypothetical protein
MRILSNKLRIRIRIHEVQKHKDLDADPDPENCSSYSPYLLLVVVIDTLFFISSFYPTYDIYLSFSLYMRGFLFVKKIRRYLPCLSKN